MTDDIRIESIESAVNEIDLLKTNTGSDAAGRKKKRLRRAEVGSSSNGPAELLKAVIPEDGEEHKLDIRV